MLLVHSHANGVTFMWWNKPTIRILKKENSKREFVVLLHMWYTGSGYTCNSEPHRDSLLSSPLLKSSHLPAPSICGASISGWTTAAWTNTEFVQVVWKHIIYSTSVVTQRQRVKQIVYGAWYYMHGTAIHTHTHTHTHTCTYCYVAQHCKILGSYCPEIYW